MSEEMHEKARAVLTRIQHDGMMRQGDPVMTLRSFMETEVVNAEERGAREMADIAYVEECRDKPDQIACAQCRAIGVEYLMRLWREGRKA